MRVFDGMIEVERLLAWKPEKPMFQEEITQALANEFRAWVKTTGAHSGVRVVCKAGMDLESRESAI
jgi:GTP cyclohydrolase I